MAKGKWGEVCATLPKADPLEGNKPEYRDKVDAAYRTLVTERLNGDVTSSSAARLYMQIRQELDKAEDVVSEITVRRIAAERLVEQTFEGEGTDSIAIEGMGGVRTQLEPQPKTVDPQAFLDWIKADPVLSKLLTLNAATAKSMIKERLQNGEALPPGVEAKSRTSFVWTRSK